ncbi:cytochrome P450 71A9-like isoform X1 [Spinacia oleracea]|uniref:Cytochrome P450 71A9-like isoform X1 n=1 Tax=Spinacia oleracea TaxID=3562 RepID=A0A9R0J944_SPIOL|nr:cytochrome P450 71A9-like isoform X1 [Spinacia oleracea]
MDFQPSLWSIFIFAIPLILLILLYKTPKEMQQKKLPPSPRKLPILGNLHQLFGDLPHICLQNLAKKHGPLMLLQLGSIPTLVISSAEVAGKIFKPHDLIFSGRPGLYAAKRLSYEFNDISFAPYGEYWREVRKIAILELLSTKRVNSFQPVRKEEVNTVIESITRTSNINLSELMLSLANNVICRVAYGKKFDGTNKAKNYEILKETQRLLGELNVADFYPWFGWFFNKVNGVDARLEKNFKELDEFYDEVIQEHVDGSRNYGEDDEDFVDVLLKLQKDPNQTIALNNDQIKGIITDMFIAGSDTSAATLVWIMSELMKNPTIMKKAQDEVRQIVKDKQRVEESDLPKFNYLKLVIKETLRLHPPVPLLVPRETTATCTIIGGYEIPAKTRVIINAKAIAMDPNVWHNPGPNVFEPERFLNSSIDYKGHDFELIPFGVGRRGCPGISFAVLLVELVLANLLFCFDWSLPEGVTRDDIDMVEAVGLTTHKKNPLLLLATPTTTNM